MAQTKYINNSVWLSFSIQAAEEVAWRWYILHAPTGYFENVLNVHNVTLLEDETKHNVTFLDHIKTSRRQVFWEIS